MRDLDDAMRQASDISINLQVQNNMEQIRTKNKVIVELTRKKEEFESKKLREIQDAELQELQRVHAKLIEEYEDIIKKKIEIFADMIQNLKQISDANTVKINDEQEFADKRLAIEIWERDIYQKQRVCLDVQIEIQTVLTLIELQEQLIADRKEQVARLQQELEEVLQEKEDFLAESAAKDEQILKLEHAIENIEDEKAKRAEEEAERRRLEEEMRRNLRGQQKMKYIPIKGDKVDELMAVYMNNFDLDVPIQRLGDGNYMFGSRKIFAKIMNDKLVIRVGGGFMLVDEFLNTFGPQEMAKMNELQNRSMASMQSPGRKGSPGAAQMNFKTVANRLSPNGGGRGSPGANRSMK